MLDDSRHLLHGLTHSPAGNRPPGTVRQWLKTPTVYAATTDYHQW